MDLRKSLGISEEGKSESVKSKRLIQYINLKLSEVGQPVFIQGKDVEFMGLATDLIKSHREKNRLLFNYLCPADRRIQNFIDSYLAEFKDKVNVRLPSNTFVLDSHGLARILSLPPDKDEFTSGIISSYRIKQGVLHNPKSDRRTTKGVFHVAEGGLPVPDDKKSVPKKVFANLLMYALQPPSELLELPFTSSMKEKAEIFVSLLLRPIVSPGVSGVTKEKSMEIRFFAPGNLASNLDFVESIFGNAGDPYLPENDAGLDISHWSGHTGCVILAPHIVRLTKKEVGLPNIKEATERQIRDGMCWKDEKELYNDGGAFKITARTGEGIIVTVIADNYFGYSKKEVKTQISYAANLLGSVEEEHAGGAIAFPSYSMGDEFHDDDMVRKDNHTFKDMIKRTSSFMDVKEEGYAVDLNYPDIIYIPENARFSLVDQSVKWGRKNSEYSVHLHPKNTYIMPAGYKVKMEKNPYVPSWRLVGTVAEGTFCHKPSTVSGGGKSEISKSINDSIIYGPFFVADFENDFKKVEEIINKDYSDRYKIKEKNPGTSRPILSRERSLGSVIKLLTPSTSRYTDEYNSWLENIPYYVKGLVYIVKRFYKSEWGNDWRKYFSVDIVDGRYGNELKYNNRKLVASYLRIGTTEEGAWRTFKLRQDFIAAAKLQMEDDITATIVVPADRFEYHNKDYNNPALKFVKNCEYRFFQRPDEAIHRGFDKQAEADLSSPNTFISNFEPLKIEDAESIMNDAIDFDKYTEPVKKLIEELIKNKKYKYFVSSAHPRIFEGSPSKNMRYLQNNPLLVDKKERYIAEVGTRLYRKLDFDKPLYFPVNSVLAGRRNNPPENGVRSLAVYNPIHYQELPELFMDFICSLTGKSPSTTGAGSEGALTKGPFNALCTVTDLNNALVSYILTGYAGFTTAAGYVGPKYRVDHDVSLLIPEIWSRLKSYEREPKFLLEHEYIEKVEDFEHNGERIQASRLGYRITEKFVRVFFGRVFENPDAVFNKEMLKPELQGMDIFIDGVNNIVEAQKRVAKSYFNDGSIEAACPPIKAILHIMVNGNYEGKTIEDPEIRNLFSREYLMNAEWYKERIKNKQLNDINFWHKHIEYLKTKMDDSNNLTKSEKNEIKEKIKTAEDKMNYVVSDKYLKSLDGFIGLDPIYKG